MSDAEHKTTDYPRHYRSAAGSTVTVPRWGVWEMEWDWFEEQACIEARPTFDDDPREPAIVASCDCCGDQRIIMRRCRAISHA